jgi:hypothetical protein
LPPSPAGAAAAAAAACALLPAAPLWVPLLLLAMPLARVGLPTSSAVAGSLSDSALMLSTQPAASEAAALGCCWWCSPRWWWLLRDAMMHCWLLPTAAAASCW